MEEVKEKLDVLSDALKTLEDGVEYFYECQEFFDNSPDRHNERAFLSARDSLIQRFEYCIDLFCKITRSYLELFEKITLSANSPRAILRESIEARLLSEDEGMRGMKMVEARNKTSHTYHEVMADEIASEIPAFYELMKTITDRMHDRLKQT